MAVNHAKKKVNLETARVYVPVKLIMLIGKYGTPPTEKKKERKN